MSVPDGARLLELAVGDIIKFDGRELRVCGACGAVFRVYRGRVAVRNVATNRLSYIQEWRLLKAKRVLAPSPREERPA